MSIVSDYLVESCGSGGGGGSQSSGGKSGGGGSASTDAGLRGSFQFFKLQKFENIFSL